MPTASIKPLLTLVSSYVLLAAVSTFFVGSWHGARVGGFRKAAKIPYPFEYASYEQVQTAAPATKSAMLAFNSAQRAHQNFNENHVTALGALLIAGLRYPVAAGVLGAVWSVNRVVYAVGYTRSGEDGGKGRYYGALWMLAHYAMVLMSGKAAYDLVMA
jgi:glutathione S-transferase